MHRNIFAIGVLVLLALWGEARGESWNATAEFSTTNGNPNGAWTYGWYSPGFGQFNLFSQTRRGGYPGWETYINGAPNPSISVNMTGSTGYGIPPEWLSLHPGPNFEPVCLRWTAPRSIDGCTYISGQFLPGDLGIGHLAILKNGTPVWTATDSGAFLLCLSVVQGDTVDFVVFGVYGAGNTPLSATVSDGAGVENLLANGGFENCAMTGCQTSSCSQSCGFAMPSWSRGPGNISVDLFQNQPAGCTPYLPDGGQFRISLQGSVCCGCDNNGWISQPVLLGLYGGYQLDLDVLMDELDALRVSCGGASVILTPDSSHPANEWTHFTWQFECTDPNMPLRLESIGTPATPACMGAEFMEIDNVVLKTAEVECIRLVPANYPTIQAAIASVPAQRHCTIQVSPGVFTGPIDFGGKDVVVRGAGANLTFITGTGGVQSAVIVFSGGEPSSAAIEDVTITGGLTGTPLPNYPSVLVGGGIFMNGTAASVRRSVIQGNSGGFGGGIYALNSTGSIEDCTVHGNSAAADGGGIQVYGGEVHVRNTVVEGNYATSRGGGMHLVEGRPHLESVEVRGNQSASIGGGITWAPVGVPAAFLEMNLCTISDNTASFAFGGLTTLQGTPNPTVSLATTAVCGNSPAPQVGGSWIDQGGNKVCECVGDLTLNGSVDGSDLGVLLGLWGPAGVSGAGDFNHDGSVDGTDLGLLLAHWGACPE